MKLTIDCPNAAYGDGMIIICKTTGQPCAHQYYKRCKGWYVLSDGAQTCPGREDKHGS